MWPTLRLSVTAAVIVAASLLLVALASTCALARAQVEHLDADLASVIRADYSADPRGVTLAPLTEGIVDVARRDESRLQATIPGIEIVPVSHQAASPVAEGGAEPATPDTPAASPGQAPPTPQSNPGGASASSNVGHLTRMAPSRAATHPTDGDPAASKPDCDTPAHVGTDLPTHARGEPERHANINTDAHAGADAEPDGDALSDANANARSVVHDSSGLETNWFAEFERAQASV